MKELNAALDLVAKIVERYELAAARPTVAACRRLQRRGDVVNVAVLGRFKAGKSSFLNDLAGRPLLPVGVLPLTTVVTQLQYGPVERAEVRYRNGREETVSVEAIAGLISEAENPGNRRQVELVSVEVATLESYRGLQFIDTPGLDSSLPHNTEATLAWLPNVAIALITISVDAPLSEYDVRLIRTVAEQTPEIAVVLTKADLVSDEERKEIEAFVAGRLEQALEKPVAIFPYSVRPGYRALRQCLKEYLLQPLLAGVDREARKILIHKSAVLLAQCANYLRVALEAARARDLDRDALKRQVLGEFSTLAETEGELDMIARRSAAETRSLLMERVRELQGPLERELVSDLKGRLARWDMNLWELSRAYEAWLERALKERLERLSEANRTRFCAPIEKSNRMLTRSVQAFHDRLAANVLRALGTELQPVEIRIEVQAPAAPDISTGRLYETHWDLIWFLIPMSVFRRSFDRYFINRMSWQVEKNLSRLVAQWSDAIHAAIADLARQAREQVRRELETIQSLLSRTSLEAPQIEDDLRQLECAGAVLRTQRGGGRPPGGEAAACRVPGGEGAG